MGILIFLALCYITHHNKQIIKNQATCTCMLHYSGLRLASSNCECNYSCLVMGTGDSDSDSDSDRDSDSD